MNTIPETIGWHICAVELPPMAVYVLTFNGRYCGHGYHRGGEWFDSVTNEIMRPQPSHWTTLQGPKQPT